MGAIELGSENKSESDFYKFSGKRGEVFTIEVSSLSLRNNRVNIDRWIDSVLRVTDANGATVSWFGGQAFNDDEFESSDSSIIDLVLPYDGEYLIEVDTFARSSSSTTYAQAVALRAELESITNPTAAQQETLQRLRDSLDDQDIGEYQLLLYRFAQANANDEIDTLKGNGGLDLIVGGPGDDYSTVVNLGAAASVDIENVFQRSIEFTDRAASSWVATVDYGDGTGVQPLTVTLTSSGEPSFELSHDYSSLGEFTVTVTVTNDLQIQTIAVLPISVVNLVPSVVIESIENHGGGSELQEGAEVLVTITSANFDGGSEPISVSVVVSRVGSSTAYASQTAVGLNAFRFTPDDNGQYEVVVTATDVRNKVSSVSRVVTVLNVAPTITSDLLPTTGIEGTTATFTAVATDAGAQDNLQYSWDFGDGTTVTGTNATHSYGDNGTYLVVLTVTDKDGASVTVNRSIVVSNANPTIVSSVIPTTAVVGVAIPFAVTGADLGANENLTYQWNFGDGTSASGASVTHTYASAGSFAVTLLVVDKDSGSASISQSITVTGGNLNSAPVLSIVGPQQVVRGQLVTVVFTATDANPQDQAGTFTYRINWGDGTPVEIVNGAATVAVAHTYTSSGTTSIVATVTDARGAVSASASKSVGVVNWLKQSDPLNPGDSMLVIGGSMGADEIRIDYQQGRRWLRIRMNGETALFANESGGNKLIDRLVIYGQNGNDFVHVDNQVNLPSLIDGGAGNDYIEAGRGNNILIGGAGNDTLIAEGGADLLIGGLGSDLLMGGTGQDLLIAGYTSFDTNRQALESIMAEWGRDSSYNSRRRNLLGQTNNGLNGGYKLRATGAQRTVFDDASIDLLLGQQGTDWYFANIDCGGMPDLLLDLQNNEEEEDID